jgi:capsular exopolysaccharide synthesis family protein
VTVGDVTEALRRFWPLATAVLVIVILVGAGAAFLPAERYRAETILFVEPSDPQSLEFGARESLTFVMPSIVRQVETDRFENAVRSRVATRVGGAEIDLSASEEPGTGVLTLTAEGTDPQRAAVVANSAAAELRTNRISDSITMSVLDPARPPESPATPRKTAILLGSGALGLIAAIFTAIAAATLRRRVAGAETIRRRFGLTVLGEIHMARGLASSPVELFHSTRFVDVAEEYHRLRTNFDILVREGSTLAVTSWAQGEGKTTVASNLGWALASLGRHVTLVDGDLRRPQLHSRFELGAARGLAHVNSPSDVPAVSHRVLPTLRVITAGHAERHPAQVLNEALPAVEEAAAGQLVLVDTPPLFTAETTLIASMVDAMVIVIDVRRRNPSELEAVLEELNVTQAKILGVVLNRTRADRRRQAAGYYYATRRTGSSSPLELPSQWFRAS